MLNNNYIKSILYKMYIAAYFTNKKKWKLKINQFFSVYTEEAIAKIINFENYFLLPKYF